ncbi:hypothetical protein CN604_24815 [Bacillus wiedmannii]|uniref:hypothetical protein n=1 Tax=Bacillus wiedmannii TaxID=1890302 RepID=UPI000BEFF38C|nr:hypothetical protein [Bacillus wiedmannii]PEL95800.1 hypothetical protein CN604_24815 [Bacillus wiedmannii]
MAKLNVKVINETVEYNGFVYESVTDGAKTNDLIQCFEDDSVDLTYEAFYLVIGTDDSNDMQFLDDDNDERDRSVTDEDFKVFRKSHAITIDKLTDAEGVVKIELPDGTKLEGTPSDLVSVTRNMQALQNEQQWQAEQVATVEMPEEAVEAKDEGEMVSERLQVGDYAKVIEEGSHSGKIGDIVKILVDDEDTQPFKCEDIHGKELNSPWFRERQLIHATESEVKEGDFARVIGNTNSHRFEIGTVVKLGTERKTDSENYFRADYLNESDSWLVRRHDLEPLTKEETEHIAREAEEEKKAKAEREEKEAERLKWAGIGREVGEIKDGDVVKVIGKGSSEHKIGDIGEVSNSSKCSNGKYSFKVNTESLKHVNWLGSGQVELIVAVEQRFDTLG